VWLGLLVHVCVSVSTKNDRRSSTASAVACVSAFANFSSKQSQQNCNELDEYVLAVTDHVKSQSVSEDLHNQLALLIC